MSGGKIVEFSDFKSVTSAQKMLRIVYPCPMTVKIFSCDIVSTSPASCPSKRLELLIILPVRRSGMTFVENSHWRKNIISARKHTSMAFQRRKETLRTECYNDNVNLLWSFLNASWLWLDTLWGDIITSRTQGNTFKTHAFNLEKRSHFEPLIPEK